jgi:hypothetical protein
MFCSSLSSSSQGLRPCGPLCFQYINPEITSIGVLFSCFLRLIFENIVRMSKSVNSANSLKHIFL